MMKPAVPIKIQDAPQTVALQYRQSRWSSNHRHKRTIITALDSDHKLSGSLGNDPKCWQGAHRIPTSLSGGHWRRFIIITHKDVN